jgi:tyrosinase
MLACAGRSSRALPDNDYLKVENVRGNFDASVLGVYVNLPENAARGRIERANQCDGSSGLG